MQTLPDGVVTFLFTDVEGSTRLWEEAPDTMMDALRQHDEAIEAAAAAHNGVPVRPRGEGDSRFIVFTSAPDAVEGSADMQRRLSTIDWVTPSPLRVRASVHTGMADLQMGDYYGSAVNRAARLRGIAHGGQTVVSGSTSELVRDQLPDDLILIDMGQHRLKDLTQPEHVFQLNVEGLDSTFPPLVSVDFFANNLPQQLTDFIGRQSELAETERLLGETRLLTILAPGGTGKTRLAIQAAVDLIDDYPDGVFFIALADLDSSTDIVQEVAESIGIALSSEQDPETQMLNYLATKRQLLVFDNFEHLSDGAAIVTQILRAAPYVSAIATTRTKLSLTGETVFILEGLDGTWDSPNQASQTSGVRLFMDAAHRSRPDLMLAPDELDPLAEILRLTDGMPLAIELAAAWADILSIEEIAAEIARNIDFLETDIGDIPDRHRSVRAVFDYTWKLLEPDEQAMFASLAPFRGGFTREAADAVAGASLRDLATLAGKSLVAANPDTGRYTIHELLRQYAEAELQSDPDQYSRILDAHADYYGDLMGEAFALAERDDELMLTIVEQDLDNVRSAWRHCLAKQNGVGAFKMVPALWMAHEIRGWVAPAVELFDEALDAFDEGSNDEATVAARALASAAQAWFLALQGEPERGLAAADQAIATLEASADEDARCIALFSRLINVVYLYQIEDWISTTEQGIALGKAIDRPYWTAAFKQWRGGAAIATGDLDTANRALLEAKGIFEQLGTRYWMGANLNHRAQVAFAEGRIENAVDLFSRSVESGRELGALRVMLLSLNGLGEANLAAGNLEAAESAFVECLATAEQMGTVLEMLNLIGKLAQIKAATGQQQEAVELLATVVADPTSAYPALLQSVPIAEVATETLTDLEKDLDADEYTAAHDAGSARFYAVAVKELIASGSKA